MRRGLAEPRLCVRQLTGGARSRSGCSAPGESIQVEQLAMRAGATVVDDRMIRRRAQECN